MELPRNDAQENRHHLESAQAGKSITAGHSASSNDQRDHVQHDRHSHENFNEAAGLKQEPGQSVNQCQQIKIEQRAKHGNQGTPSVDHLATTTVGRAKKGKSRADVPLIILDDEGVMIKEERIEPGESQIDDHELSRPSIQSEVHEPDVLQHDQSEISHAYVQPQEQQGLANDHTAAGQEITVASLLARPEVFAGLCSSQNLIATLLQEAGKNMQGERGKRVREELGNLMPVEMPLAKRMRRE